MKPRTTRAPTRAPKPASVPKTPAQTPRRALPAALREGAEALHARGQARLKARGEEALARVRDKLEDLAENVFEIGEALAQLASEGVAKAMGYADFEDVCRRGLALSPTTARRWMTLALRLER